MAEKAWAQDAAANVYISAGEIYVYNPQGSNLTKTRKAR